MTAKQTGAIVLWLFFKSHKCECHAALELLEFNSTNDVFLYKGCMAKIILFAL